MNGEGSNSRSTYIPYSLVQETLGSLKETGGRLLEPLLGVSTSKKVPLNILENGITYKLTVGDYLFIPAGEPHMHGSATFARLTIVKIPAR